MERIGCFFLTARSISDLAARVRAAEELGYEIAGFPHIAGRDALTTVAVVGERTERIGLATGIVPAYTRTPVALAQEAGTIAESTNGRFLLGIGSGHKALVESWHGQQFHHPVEAMRDYLTIVRTLLRDGSVSYNGAQFSGHFGFLGFTPPPVPILVGALGPRMLQLAGELADGVVLWMSSPRHVREVVLPNLAIGAARAGRDPSELEVFACLFAAPGPDRASARDAIRRQLLPYMALPFYRDMLAASGFSDDLVRYDAGIADQNLPAALSALSDAMIDEIATTGSPDDVAHTLQAFVDAGATVPGVGPVGGYEGYENTAVSLRMLKDAFATARRA